MENPPDISAQSGSAAGARAYRVRWLAIAAGLLALLVLGLWAESRGRLADLQEDIARRLAEGDAATREQRVLVRQDHDSLAALQARVTALEARLAESQGQALALEALAQELSRSRDERVAAEVEQAVAIAAQQLQLAGNVEAALIALQAADSRLSRAASPRFLPVRRLIARDIDRLRALPTADISGLSIKLESVAAGVDGLPLAFERRPREEKRQPSGTPPESEVPVWQRLAAELRDEIRQLVKIERLDQPEAALLAPGQAYFLREHLKLRLLAAKLALLQRDARAWREELRLVRSAIERHFDVQAKPVQAIQSSLKALAATDVGGPVAGTEGLNETLAALRNLKLVPDKAR